MNQNLPQLAISAAEHLPWRDISLATLLGTTALNTGLLAYIALHRPQTEDQIEPENDSLPETNPNGADPEPKIIRSPWCYDGATRTGKVRTENQDAFFTTQADDGTVFLGVFDGAGGVPGGKEAAEMAAAFCQTYLIDQYDAKLEPRVLLHETLMAAHFDFVDKDLLGITTAILVMLQGDQMHYATLGDGALASIWPDGMVHHFLVPHHVLGEADNVIAGYLTRDRFIEPRLGTAHIEMGTHIMLMSDGVSDLFPYSQLAEIRETIADQLISHPNLADDFLDQIEAARDPASQAYLHSDNLTLIMACLSDVSSEQEAEQCASIRSN